MDPVTKRTRGAVDQDFITGTQQRLHRIAFRPDGGKLRSFQPLFAQPAAGEPEIIKRQLRQLVADDTIMSVDHTMLPDERLVVKAELLLLQDT